MTDAPAPPKKPTAAVVRRAVPRVTKDSVFPTAQSRIEIHKSSRVVIPLAQPTELHDRPAPTFTPVGRATSRWVLATWIVLLLAVIAACAYAYYLAR